MKKIFRKFKIHIRRIIGVTLSIASIFSILAIAPVAEVSAAVSTVQTDLIEGNTLSNKRIKWTDRTGSDRLNRIGSATYNVFDDCDKVTSDLRYDTDTGWVRLILTSGSNMSNCMPNDTEHLQTGATSTILDVDGFACIVGGKVSDNGYSEYLQCFAHPHYLLKNAMIDHDGNKNLSGILGSDYVKPQVLTTLTRAYTGTFYEGAPTSLFAFGGTGYTNDNIDCIFLKYAGVDSSKNPLYYVAFRGNDGQLHLMCNINYIVGNGAEYDNQVFVTASEYKKYPEMFQKRYAWPTEDTDSVGNYTGQWKVGDKSVTVTKWHGVETNDECFEVPVSDNSNIKWSLAADSNYLYYFSNDTVYDYNENTFNNTQIMKWYQANKENIDSSITAYADACIAKIKTAPTTCKVGTYIDGAGAIAWIGSAEEGWSGLVNSSHVLFSRLNETRLKLNVGLYYMIGFEKTESSIIYVGDGSTLVVQGETLNISNGQTLLIDQGGTVRVKGKIAVAGNLTCYGTLIIEDGGIVCDADLGGRKDSGYGNYYFSGASLIIAKNGTFYTRRNQRSDNVCFTYGTNIQNNGIFICHHGFYMYLSIFDNCSSGVVMTGGGLRNAANTITTAYKFVRGLPSAKERKAIVDNGMICYNGNYIYNSTDYPVAASPTDFYTCYLLPVLVGSIFRNNGMYYNFSGMVFDQYKEDSVTLQSMFLGNNRPLFYSDLALYNDGTSDSYNYVTKNIMDSKTFKDFDQTLDENYYNNTVRGFDIFSNNPYVLIGYQTAQDANAAGKLNTMDYNTWKNTYRTVVQYNDPKPKSDDGC